MTGRKTFKQRFYEMRPDYLGPDDCWDWRGHLTSGGYGSILKDGKQIRAHRAAWEIENDEEIPDGLLVRHTCDNRKCVNPNHLCLGTPADNSRDMVERGRSHITIPGSVVREAVALVKSGMTRKEASRLMAERGFKLSIGSISSWIAGRQRKEAFQPAQWELDFEDYENPL